MASVVDTEPDKYSIIHFEETELRLGLPGVTLVNDHAEEQHKNTNAIAATPATAVASGKRGFSQTVDLKLNLSCSKDPANSCDDVAVDKTKAKVAVDPRCNDSVKPPAKEQVVGWPPLRSFRKNFASVQKSNTDGEDEKGSCSSSVFVKVSMDGAPYLRKVDLKLYKSYQEISDALAKMFSPFTIGHCGCDPQGMKDSMNESNLIDLLNGSDFGPTYEDKDGDWMLVGDVPWEMFVCSCKRLRIMQGSEAIGLAPRAVEKCKNRS